MPSNTASSTTAVLISGGLIGVLGGLVLGFSLRQWTAIRELVIDRDGWILVDRLGRTTGIDAGVAIELTLRCRRVVFSWGGIPRIRDVVDGWVRAGAVRRRLAPSGPYTYRQILADLGAAGGPPARGTSARYPLTSG